jgi:hypothetical protein
MSFVGWSKIIKLSYPEVSTFFTTIGLLVLSLTCLSHGSIPNKITNSEQTTLSPRILQHYSSLLTPGILAGLGWFSTEIKHIEASIVDGRLGEKKEDQREREFALLWEMTSKGKVARNNTWVDNWIGCVLGFSISNSCFLHCFNCGGVIIIIIIITIQNKLLGSLLALN